MSKILHVFLDWASPFFAHRRGLLPLIGIGLIIVNLIVVSVFSPEYFIVYSNLFLHLGVIVAIIGSLLAWAL
jgi:hypothetical protein